MSSSQGLFSQLTGGLIGPISVWRIANEENIEWQRVATRLALGGKEKCGF
jgi:hypothetical protein